MLILEPFKPLRDIPEMAYRFRDDVSEKDYLVKVLNYDLGTNYTKEQLTFSHPTDVREDTLLEDNSNIVEVNENIQANTEVTITYQEGVKGLRFKKYRYHRLNIRNACYLVFGKKRPNKLPDINWGSIEDPSNKSKALEWLTRYIPSRKNSILEVNFNSNSKSIQFISNPLSLIFKGELVIYLENNSNTQDGWIGGYGANLIPE